MSPDACIGLLHLADRWAMTLRCLRGEPLPALPAQPGRIVKAPKPMEPEADAELQDAELKAAAVWRELAADNEGADLD